MAQEVGKVTKIEDGWLHVQIPTGEGCTSCGAKTACSFKGPESAYRSMKIPYRNGITAGNLVKLEIPDWSQNLATLIVFVLPIFLILGSYLLANYYFRIPNSEIWGILAGFVLYVAALYFFNRVLSKSPSFSPRVIGEAESETKNDLIPD